LYILLNINSSKNAKYGPSLTSLGLVHQNENISTTGNCHTQNQRTTNENTEDDELDLTGIDDEEIQSYILTEAESSIKAKFWTARNSEHLALMAEKFLILKNRNNIFWNSGKEQRKKKRQTKQMTQFQGNGGKYAQLGKRKLTQMTRMKQCCKLFRFAIELYWTINIFIITGKELIQQNKL
jgi:hypothetical protein